MTDALKREVERKSAAINLIILILAGIASDIRISSTMRILCRAICTFCARLPRMLINHRVPFGIARSADACKYALITFTQHPHTLTHIKRQRQRSGCGQ